MTLPPNNDLKAFEKIVAAHEAAVRAYVALRIDDPFEAHDLALEGPVLTALEHCLDVLDDAARRLVRWRYADGLGIREICKRTDSGHSAVTMKLHRVRSLLFDYIQGRVEEASP